MYGHTVLDKPCIAFASIHSPSFIQPTTTTTTTTTTSNIIKMAHPNRQLVIAAIQMQCSQSQSTNIQVASNLIRQAVAQHRPDIVVLPELFLGHYFCKNQQALQGTDVACAASSDPSHNAALAHFMQLARELQVAIPFSFFESANVVTYNSVVMIDRHGSNIGVYRKSHIPDGPGYQEKYYFTPGDTGFQVFELDTLHGTVKVGVAICWDQWFPEAARIMALKGAEVLVYPTAIGSEPQDAELDSQMHWTRTMQGHAAANLVPVVACNRIGEETGMLLQRSHTQPVASD
jgi:N-carbamoylputrescine amidase